MRHWTTDYAVMFYAPWCTHCKEAFMPLWEDVALQMAHEDPKGKRKLVMGKFDCEQDTAAANFCHEINLEFYPTFVFYGAGKFHDYDPVSGMALGRPTEHDSSAKFPSKAMVYFDVMLDWTKAMHLISRSNRVMEKLSPSRFWSKKEQGSSEERLLEEMEALERQNHQLQEALAGGGPSIAADSSGGAEAGELIYGYGDPYADLHAVSYDAQFEPIMVCVEELATQYCELEGVVDPWCNTLERCAATEFAGEECWPDRCPLAEEGCKITSFCLSPEVFEAYMNMFDEESEANDNAAAADWGQGGEEAGDFWTWSDADVGGGPEAAAEAAASEQAASEQQGGAAPALPPFFGRRSAGGGGSQAGGAGVDRGADDRGEAVAGV
ncbi:unnamed protein product [Scytosiphon promiscuus]